MKPQLRSLLILVLCIVLAVSGCALWEREPQLEFSYTAKTTQCNPGEKITITVSATNVGHTFTVTGDPTASFSDATLFITQDDTSYSFDSQIRFFNDDATERPFKKGETHQCSFTFQIPQDVPSGSYDLSFWCFGIKVEFERAIQITDSN